MTNLANIQALQIKNLNIRVANTFLSRLQGLLFATPLSEYEALLIQPCNSIHTFGMGYAIDVVFLNNAGQILHIVPQLKPWRAASHRPANQTLELKAGLAARRGLQVGMQL